MFKAYVNVMLKSGIFDPQGRSVCDGLHVIGFPEVTDVRVGRRVELKLEESSRERAEHRVEEMCRRLLANPVVESYSFRVEEI